MIYKTKPCIICADPIDNDKTICRKCAHAIHVGSHLAKSSRQFGKTNLQYLILKDIMDYEFGIDIGVREE